MLCVDVTPKIDGVEIELANIEPTFDDVEGVAPKLGVELFLLLLSLLLLLLMVEVGVAAMVVVLLPIANTDVFELVVVVVDVLPKEKPVLPSLVDDADGTRNVNVEVEDDPNVGKVGFTLESNDIGTLATTFVAELFGAAVFAIALPPIVEFPNIPLLCDVFAAETNTNASGFEVV